MNNLIILWIFEGLLISSRSCICHVHIMNKIKMKKKWMSKFPINWGFFLSLWTLIWHISVCYISFGNGPGTIYYLLLMQRKAISLSMQRNIIGHAMPNAIRSNVIQLAQIASKCFLLDNRMQRNICLLYLGLDARKPVFGGLRTTKVPAHTRSLISACVNR